METAVTSDITLEAKFTKKSTSAYSSSGVSYKITTKATGEGKISPSNTYVSKNKDKTFTFTPDAGYVVADVLVDGTSVGKVTTYKLEKVTSKHTIEVKFEKSNSSSWAGDEIDNAREAGLIPETFVNLDFTKPINRTQFAALAVKLYEAITGNKSQVPAYNPFTDTQDEYVLKAFGLGITNGTSETTFSPDREITREELATMVMRAIKKAGVNTSFDINAIAKFTDDAQMNDWSRDAIYFLSSHEVIKGIGDNRFGLVNNSTIEQAIAISNRCFTLWK